MGKYHQSTQKHGEVLIFQNVIQGMYLGGHITAFRYMTMTGTST
jgi:uncharacterized membrane protein